MKKIFLPLAVIAVCALVYLTLSPIANKQLGNNDDPTFQNLESKANPYMTDSEVLVYLNLGLAGDQHFDESDVQAYTPTDAMKRSDLPSRLKKRYYEVTNSEPRPSTLGFSIVPPPGSDWYEKLDKNSLIYVKINDLHKQYVILSKAREIRLKKKLLNPADIQSYVKREKEKDMVSSSFKEPKLFFQVEESLPEVCIRYIQNYQDHGVKGLRGGNYVKVDIQGIFCRHPDNTKVAIDLSYMEKSLSNAQVPSYGNEGEKFLASLKFH